MNQEPGTAASAGAERTDAAEERTAGDRTAAAEEPAAGEQPAAADEAAGRAESKDAPDSEGGQTEAAEADPVVEVRASELEQLKAAAEENYQRFLRVQADFENFRRRTRQEKEEIVKYASQQLIAALLPVVDNFDRAVAASREKPDFDAFAKGIEMIRRQLFQVLENEGLRAIEAVGQPFNPDYHQAIMKAPAEEGVESGTVIEELQKGYILKERVLRPAMVKVAE